jgi:hypothetical protein
MRNIYYLIVIAILFQNCKKESANDSQDAISGKFALSLSSNLKSAAIIKSDDSANFDLDTIKSSRSFYFILSNVGQEDITDISISTDNSSFNVTPSAIQILAGTNTKNSATLSQAISLDIIHGTRINGVGYTGLLNMGDNFCNINVQGQTTDGKSGITVKLKAKIKVYAKVMAISLYQGAQKYDFVKKPLNLVIGGPFDIGQMNYYYYYSNSFHLVLKNTGNVSFIMTVASFEYNYPIILNTTVNPLDTLILNLQKQVEGLGGAIRLNSNGTIFDQQKLNLGNDGNAYFALYCSLQTTPVTPIDSTNKK